MQTLRCRIECSILGGIRPSLESEAKRKLALQRNRMFQLQGLEIEELASIETVIQDITQALLYSKMRFDES